MNAARFAVLPCILLVGCARTSPTVSQTTGEDKYQVMFRPVVAKLKENPAVESVTAQCHEGLTTQIVGYVRVKKSVSKDEAKRIVAEAVVLLMDANTQETRKPGTGVCPTDFEYVVGAYSPGNTQLALVSKNKNASELRWID